MQGRLSDNLVMPMTIINPPAPQEMHLPEGPKLETVNGKEEDSDAHIHALPDV